MEIIEKNKIDDIVSDIIATIVGSTYYANDEIYNDVIDAIYAMRTAGLTIDETMVEVAVRLVLLGVTRHIIYSDYTDLIKSVAAAIIAEEV